MSKSFMLRLSRVLAGALLACSALGFAGLAHAAPALLYSDLDSGPNTGGQGNLGAFVTLWGKGFGLTRGTVTVGGGQVANYVSWTDTKIVVQLGGSARSGEIVVTSGGGASNGLPFTVRAGRIQFVSPSGNGNGSFESPMSPSAAYTAMRAGDIYYFRGGNYQGNFGGNWGSRNYALGPSKGGTAGNPLALVGYPGEVATITSPDANGHGNIELRDGQGQAHYVTIANLNLVGGSICVGGGGYWETNQGGATNVRVVGNTFSSRYTTNTMTGLVTVQNNTWRVLGNEFKNAGTPTPINNNHALYVQTGASDVDIGWNYFHDLRMGHVIQVHTDIAYSYRDIRIHHNVITNGATGDSRGINVGLARADSYGSIHGNVLYNVGQEFSGIAIYSGAWKVYNNTLYNVRGLAMAWISNQYGQQPTAEFVNNVFQSNGSAYVVAAHGASESQLTLNNNLYFGNGNGPSRDARAVNANPLFANPAAGDFRLGTSSPAIDRGVAAVNLLVTVDGEGIARPQNAGFDLGAFEVAGNALPKPAGLKVTPQ